MSATEIKIGGLWFHESYLDRYSRAAEHAVDAYFADINRAGGIYGRKITYIPCIDGGDMTRTQQCLKDLVENKKVFMLGPSISWGTGSIQDQVNKVYKIPFVGSFGLYLNEFDPANAPYSYPSQVPVNYIGRMFAKVVGGMLPPDQRPATVAISYLNIEAAQECMAGVELVAQKYGFRVVVKAGNEFDEPDLTPQVLRIRSANPEMVLFCNDPVNNAKFVGVAARNQRYKPPKGWAGGWPTVPEFVEIVGDWGIGHFGMSTVCYHEAPECDANPDVKLFKQQMNAQYPGELSRMHYYGQNMWCGAKMIVEALKAVGPNLTRQALVDVLDSGKFWGWECMGMRLYYKKGDKSGSRKGQVLQIVDPDGNPSTADQRWKLIIPEVTAE